MSEVVENIRSVCCPICGGTHLESCWHYENIPTFANVTANTKEEALKAACGTLNIVLCNSCGFVFNADFEPRLVQYDQAYQADTAQSSVYQRFLKHIASLVHQTLPLEQGHIVEIGCGAGTFLRLLQQTFGYKVQLLGVDPSVQAHCEGNIRFCTSLFNEHFVKTMPQDVRLIVSRHMIEHMPNPLALLRICAKALPDDGLLYLETPRLDWILEHKAFFDFGYEHCSYFSDSFMASLLDAANLQIVSMEKSFNEQYFSLCLQKKKASLVQTEQSQRYSALSLTSCGVEQIKLAKAPLAELENIRQGFKELKLAYLKMAESFKATSESCIWGCSQKGEIFLNLFDPECKCCVVDISLNKHGRYVLGTGHKILAPEQLENMKINNVIVMNPNYLEEISALVKRICPAQSINFQTV